MRVKRENRKAKQNVPDGSSIQTMVGAAGAPS
jgi:hypothetical protein